MKIILNENTFNLLFERMSMEEIDNEAYNANVFATDNQRRAGNYRKGHVRVKGMSISIENPRGRFRKYDGGETEMQNHYGYFSKTKGRDGDQVDVFLGPHLDDFDHVFVIDQNDKDGNFDESKVMLGFLSTQEAKEAYISNYSEDWDGFGSVTQCTLKTFKKWLYRDRKQRKPFRDYVMFKNKIKKDLKKNEL